MRKIILLVLMCLPFLGYGQDVQFKANAPEAVRVGEQFRLTYTVNARGADFDYPDMDGFNILSGPNASTSSNFQWVNGKSSQTVTTTYTFYLSAKTSGEFTIVPASIEVDRKRYKSNSVTITVLANNQGGTNKGQSSSGGQSSAQQRKSYQYGGKDVFITGEASKRNVYVGEQFVFSHKIYTKLDLSGFGDVRFPAYTGFWKEDVEIGNINLRQTNYNGEAYYYDEIQRNILFPQKSGELVIEPATVEVVARVRQSGGSVTGDPFFDNFFQNYSNVNFNCESKPVTINVMPLPAKGRPASFSGAVGNFTMTGTIDKTNLDANEALTVKFTINGSGNIKLIDKLNIKFPYDFEVYEPKVTQNIKVNTDAVYGTKSFEYVAIPRNSGDFLIPSFEFSFFNPVTEKYVVLKSPEFDVHVNESSTALHEVHSVGKEDVVSIGEDIRYIKTRVPNFKKQTMSFFLTLMYFLVLALIVVIFVAAIFVTKKIMIMRSDVEGSKRKRAESVAMKRLKKAKEYLDAKNHDKFYDEVANAMWQYISDRFNVPNSALSRDFLMNLADEGKISHEDAEKFVMVITNAEFARFAPGNASDSMSDIYAQAVEVIKLFYSKLK